MLVPNYKELVLQPEKGLSLMFCPRARSHNWGVPRFGSDNKDFAMFHFQTLNDRTNIKNHFPSFGFLFIHHHNDLHPIKFRYSFTHCHKISVWEAYFSCSKCL